MQEVTKKGDWNDFVLEHGPESGAFLQSWEWGEAQNALGHAVRRYRSKDACVQLVERSLPLGKRYAYVARGPVAPDMDKAKDALLLLKGAVQEALFLRVDVPFAHGAVPSGLRVRDVQPDTTLITSLVPDTPALLENMHHKTRYNIRLAQRKGVEIILDAPAEQYLDAFVALVQETAARHGIRAHGREHYATLLEHLDGRDGGPRAFLSIAEYEGTPLVAHLMIDWKGQRVYLHGASSDKEKRLMAPYLLHWNLLQDAKQQGVTSYDWWGIAPEGSVDHKLAGVTRFKKGFGGKVVAYAGTYDLPLKNMWYALYGWVQKLRGRSIVYK